MSARLSPFSKADTAGGIILFLTAFLAMLWANSPLAYLYHQLTHLFLFTINEGLMAIFFLLVGLELKRGYLHDELKDLSQILLPLAAAIGGMILPALIYLLLNYHHPETAAGWATPVATDIAFAVGVLSLFGRRVKLGVKLFLLMLAIFDDVGAILIIAFYFAQGLKLIWLILSGLLFAILLILNFHKVNLLFWYLLLGVLLWIALLNSGVHPTIAGVLLALTIPADKIMVLETTLKPWVLFGIMPLFALVNTGFSFNIISWQSLTSTLVLGIVAGLFFGKQLGIAGFSWFIIKLKLSHRPSNCSWLTLYGIAILCGIGFTMSLFLGTLSFQNEARYLAEVRLGVIIGSILSGIVGAMVLLMALPQIKFSKE